MISAIAILLLAQDAAGAPAADIPACGAAYGRLVASRTTEFPVAGEEASVEIGQSMVSSSRLDTHEAGFRLTSPAVFTGKVMFSDYVLTIPAETSFTEVTGLDGIDYVPAVVEYTLNGRPRTGIVVPDVTMAVERHSPGRLIVLLNFGFTTQTQYLQPAEFTTHLCSRLGRDGFSRQLIYGGVSQGTVSIDYREFIDNLARPAFSQTLRYDLNEGREIGFRGARFEILDANNVSVRYRVVRSLDR